MGFRNVVIVGMIAVWKLDMYRCVEDQEYLVEVPLYKEQSGVKSLYANPYLIAYSSIGRPASIQANKVHCGASFYRGRTVRRMNGEHYGTPATWQLSHHRIALSRSNQCPWDSSFPLGRSETFLEYCQPAIRTFPGPVPSYTASSRDHLILIRIPR